MEQKILLHSCCAPCSTASCESLIAVDKNPVLFWYNPNIEPFNEHEKRLIELKRLAKCLDLDMIKFSYDYDEENAKWHDFIKGNEKELEGGKRCTLCFRFRLEKVKEIANKLNLPFTTTLTVSRYKNSKLILGIGNEIDQKDFLDCDFKKNDGYKLSIELSKKYELYRQNYCGCLYSKKISA